MPAWQRELDAASNIWSCCGDFDKGGEFDDAKFARVTAEAEAHVRKALELAKSSRDIIGQAKSLFELGEALARKDQYAAAIAAYEESLKAYKLHDPADTLEVADCYQEIAVAINMADEPDTAAVVDNMTKAYAIYSRYLSDDDQRLDLSVSFLADYAASPAEAIPFRRQRVKINKRHEGKYPSLIGSELLVLAVDLSNNGQLDEAIATAREAIDYCRREAGEESYVEFIQENIDHWRQQKAGLEEPWDVIYRGEYAGRNPREKSKKPNPPTAAVRPDSDSSPGAGTEAAPQGSTDMETPEDASSEDGSEASGEPQETEPPKHDPPGRRPGPKRDSGGRRYYVSGQEVSREEYEAMLLSNEASTLISAHKYQEARAKLTQALSRNPNLCYAHANLGLVLGKLGLNQDAEEHLKVAVELDSGQSAPLGMLASFYQTTGDLDKAIETFRQYVKKFPRETDVDGVKACIASLEEVREQQRQVESDAGPLPSAHYLPFVTHKGVHRWDKNRLPLKVYLANGSRVLGFRSSYSNLLKEAFEAWTQRTGDLIQFQFVNTKSDADIDCYFTNDYRRVQSLAECGEAQSTYNEASGAMAHCTIVLMTISSPTSTMNPSDNDMLATALHEIGHALGMHGHSPQPEDILYFSATDTELKRPTLTTRDVNTLQRLYEQ